MKATIRFSTILRLNFSTDEYVSISLLVFSYSMPYHTVLPFGLVPDLSHLIPSMVVKL